MAGRAVVANPLHGCTPLENEKKVAGRLLVAERGACMFIEKALQAQAAGAVGLVIYDMGIPKTQQRKGQQPKRQQEQQQEAGSGAAQPQAPSASPSPADSAGQQSSEPGAAAPPPMQGAPAPFAPFSMSGDGVHDKQIRIPLAFIENAHGIDLLELIRTAESEQDAAIVIAPQAVLSCMNSWDRF